MGDDSLENNLIDALAEEFVARLRRGERPALTEYAARHPELADEIRDLFPMLVTMEQARPATSHLSSPGNRAMLPSAEGWGLDRLGDYRILREVGRGGMGIVYEAEQESLGRHVALKVLPRHALFDIRQLQRFQQEARAAARLHHTNIVPVFGVGEQEGLHYYVMQFIQGLGMDQVLVELARLRLAKKKPSTKKLTAAHSQSEAAKPAAVHVAASLLSGEFDVHSSGSGSGAMPNGSSDLHVGLAASENSTASVQLPLTDSQTSFSDSGRNYWHSVARIGVQVAEALAYAHGQGVLHRDIKPSNLLLDTRGTVWVTDFGLAKASDSDDLTHTGDVVGTLRYLAPERLGGTSDQRSDIYGLGITLYELLTQRQAFPQSDRNKLIQQVTQQEPPRPRAIDAEIPLDLETIVLKSIAKNPSDRYASPAEMALDLRHFLEDKPIRARRAGVLELSWRWCRRNPLIAGLATTICLLSLVLGAGGLVITLLRSERDSALLSQRRAEKAEGSARTLLSRATAAEQEVTIRQHLAQAVAHRRSGQMGQRFECLAEITQAMQLGPSPELRRELRGEAVAALGLTDLRLDRQWAEPSVLNGACDPRLRYVATVEDVSFHVHVRRTDDQKEILTIPNDSLDAWHADVAFSADGELLAIEYWLRDEPDALLDVWQVSSRKRVLRQQVHSSIVRIAAAFHPNNRWIVFADAEGHLCVWDCIDNRELYRHAFELTPFSITLDSQGQRIAVNDVSHPVVRIIELTTGRVLHEWRQQVGRWAMAWSSDDRLLAMADLRIVYIWDVEQARLMSVIDERGNAVNHLQFARDSYLLATTGYDGYTRLWDAVSGEPLVVAEGTFCQFSEDGSELAFVNSMRDEVGRWLVTHAQQRRALHPDMYGNRNEDRLVRAPQFKESGLFGATISEDGQLLACSVGSGVVLFGINSEQALAHLEVGWCSRALIHPRGDHLLTWSEAGLLRWPIRRQVTEAAVALNIGPPTRLSPLDATDFWCDMQWMPGHDAVVLNDHERSRLVMVGDQEPASAPLAVLPSRFPRVTCISVSSDGQWIAGGGHKEPGVQIWNVRTKEVTRVLQPRDEPGDTLFWVRFSPDDRWLVMMLHDGAGRPLGYSFWDVQHWEKQHFIRSATTGSLGAAFTTNGNRMALSTSTQELLIAKSENVGELVRLSTLPTLRCAPAFFSPDGEKLFATSGADTLIVWNLKTLREQLTQLHLDWDDSALPRARTEVLPAISFMSVDQGSAPQWVAQTHRREQAEEHRKASLRYQDEARWKEAIAELEQAISVQPEHGQILNELAWLLLICPEASLRDAPRAVELSTRAVAAEPTDAPARNTLGIAQYRVGNWRAAIDELKTAEQLAPGKYFGHNMLFIAMARWQLGDKEGAKEDLSAAQEWIKNRDPSFSGAAAEELRQFQSEAAALIEADSL